MRKWLGILIVLISLFTGFGQGTLTLAAGSDVDLVILNYDISKEQIVKGDSFTLDITLKKYAPVLEKITGVYLVVDSNHESSFEVKNDSSYVNTLQTDHGNGEITYQATVTLKYNGGSSTELPIHIGYDKDGEEKGFNTSIKIDNIYYEGQDTKQFIPRLNVSDSSIPSVRAGEALSVTLTINNTSKYTAKDINITPVINPGDEKSLFYDNLSPVQSIPLILPGRSEKVTFKFKTSKDANEKTYPIDLKYEFNNTYGNTFSSTNTVYVRVTDTAVKEQGTAPELSIKNIENSSWMVTSGESSNLKIDIENLGTLPAKNIKVTLQGLKEDGFSVLSGTNIKYITKIDGGQKTSVNYSLASSSKMETGNYGLTVKIEYEDEAGKEYTAEEQFFMRAVNEGTNTGGKSVPKIILSRYSCNPSIVRAGRNFDLSLAFLNTSDSKVIQNIKVYLTVNETSTEGGNIFTPVNSSNTFYVDRIEPKEEVEKSLLLYTIPDAKQKTYTITANFEYEDAQGNEYKATELIGIPVMQQTKLETTEITMPPESYPGQPFPVGFDFYNMGKVVLGNLMIKVEGDFDLQNPSYFVGNFEPGSTDHFESMIIPRAPGTASGKIVISYDDPSGEHMEEVKDFTLKVIDMPQQQMPSGGEKPGMPMEGEKQGGIKKLIKSPYVWGGSVLFATAVVFVIIKIKKKKGGIELDE